jgi:hypothetical protein
MSEKESTYKKGVSDESFVRFNSMMMDTTNDASRT